MDRNAAGRCPLHHNRLPPRTTQKIMPPRTKTSKANTNEHTFRSSIRMLLGVQWTCFFALMHVITGTSSPRCRRHHARFCASAQLPRGMPVKIVGFNGLMASHSSLASALHNEQASCQWRGGSATKQLDRARTWHPRQLLEESWRSGRTNQQTRQTHTSADAPRHTHNRLQQNVAPHRASLLHISRSAISLGRRPHARSTPASKSASTPSRSQKILTGASTGAALQLLPLLSAVAVANDRLRCRAKRAPAGTACFVIAATNCEGKGLKATTEWPSRAVVRLSVTPARRMLAHGFADCWHKIFFGDSTGCFWRCEQNLASTERIRRSKSVGYILRALATSNRLIAMLLWSSSSTLRRFGLEQAAT